MSTRARGTGGAPEARTSRGGTKRGAGDAHVLGVRLSSPDRVVYPEQGVTKLDLARYWAEVAPRALPHLRDRPLSLVRCPRGRGEACFYQKHPGDSVPDLVPRIRIREKEGSGEYAWVDSAEALVALVQVGVLELHVWGSRVDRLERPDRVVFDLDPAPDVEWGAVVETARLLRAFLAELELQSWVKTTGGKGLHVVVPVVRRQGWDDVKAFARAVAEAVALGGPDRYLTEASRSKREGRIFIDWLRNTRGATAVAPYSTRARPGAPVAVPLDWEELEASTDPGAFDLETVPRRLAALDPDPWEGMGRTRQSVTARVRKALGLG